MFRKVLLLTAIVLVFAASNLRAEQKLCRWVGGEEGLWGDPSNWDCAMVPDNGGGNTFAVTINAGGIEVEIFIHQHYTIDQLDCNGVVELEMWTDWAQLTLEDTNGLTNYGGDLDIEGDWHSDINGNITNTAGAELYLEDLEIDGNLFNPADGKIGVKGKVDTDGGDLENLGLIQIAPSSEFYVEQHFQNVGQILIYGGACGSDEILDNDSPGIIQGFGVLRAEELLRNKGTIYADGGVLTIVWLEKAPMLNSGILGNKPASFLHVRPGYLGTAKDVNNHGRIEVYAGGATTFDCNLTNEPNGVIELLGGTLAATSITQSADANFVGFGGITVDDEILIESGAKIELTGPTNIVGDVNIPVNATLEISDGTTLVTSDCTCNNGTIHMKGGRIIIQGVFSNNNCRIIWEPGTYTNIADFNLDGTVNFKDFADFANTWLWRASVN